MLSLIMLGRVICRRAARIASCAGVVLGLHIAAPVQAAIYYVDFERGSDQSDGLSRQSAWKHAPGDSNARLQPAQARLNPGDIVQFKGGVAYRGSLALRFTGRADAPIRYQGSGWGDEPAILTGNDAAELALEPCAAVPGCAGLMLPGKDLLAARLPEGFRSDAPLTLDGRRLMLAQEPALADPFWADDISRYFPAPAPSPSANSSGSEWRLTHNALARPALAATADMFLYLWGMPNLIYEASVRSIDTASGAAVVSAPRFRPYPDRETRFAIVNHPALIRRAGEYATAEGGRLLVVQFDGGPRRVRAEMSRRAFAIDVSGAAYLAIEGFEITGYAGQKTDQKGGVALWVGNNARGISFRDNQVHDLESRAGSGAVQAMSADGLLIEGNRFEELLFGSVVRSGNGVSNMTIAGNIVRRVGRTGFAILGSENVVVKNNRLSGIHGVHGNAISVYLAAKNVAVSNNLIFDSVRAITFHGAPGATNDLVIRNNVIAVTGPSSVGIQSWGKNTNGVEISGNVVLAPGDRAAIHLNLDDRRVAVANNYADSIYIPRQLPDDWTVARNVFSQPAPAKFRQPAALPAGNSFDAGKLQALRTVNFADKAALCRAVGAIASGAGPADLCRP